MPGIWYQVSLTVGGRRVSGAAMAGLPGIFMGQNNDVCWTFTNVSPTSRTCLSSGSRGTATCSRGSGGRSRAWRRRSPSRAGTARGAGGALHPSRAACQRGPRRRRGRAAGAELGLAGRATVYLGCSTSSTSAPEASWSRSLSGHSTPASNDLGRPRFDRLQADRLPAAAEGRLPRPAQAGLERRVRVGGHDSLRGAARGRRPRERLPGHRQQPGRRRRLPAPHHQ